MHMISNKFYFVEFVCEILNVVNSCTSKFINIFSKSINVNVLPIKESFYINFINWVSIIYFDGVVIKLQAIFVSISGRVIKTDVFRIRFWSFLAKRSAFWVNTFWSDTQKEIPYVIIDDDLTRIIIVRWSSKPFTLNSQKTNTHSISRAIDNKQYWN